MKRPAFLFLISLTMLAACNKSDLRKNEKMLRGDWRMTEKYMDDGSDSSFKGNRVPGTCLEQTVTTFKKNGVYILDPKGGSCIEASRKECTWTILPDERTIMFTEKNSTDTTYSLITELTEHTLILTETRNRDAQALSGRFVYEKID
jgi:hypothetical protein